MGPAHRIFFLSLDFFLKFACRPKKCFSRDWDFMRVLLGICIFLAGNIASAFYSNRSVLCFSQFSEEFVEGKLLLLLLLHHGYRNRIRRVSPIFEMILCTFCFIQSELKIFSPMPVHLEVPFSTREMHLL